MDRDASNMSVNVEKLLCAIDIGTSKVVALIAENNMHDEPNIIGIGTQPSKGLKKGNIVNIEATVRAIQMAVQEAEEMAGCQIEQACISISGEHIKSFDSHGVVAIEKSEVSQEDLTHVIESAKAVPMPADQEILHILNQDFIIDHHGGIKEPVGMAGVRLEAKVHMVTASSGAVQNTRKCVTRCGVNIEDVVLQPLASSNAVLSDDEKELGVCMIDIGAGTTDVAVFTDNAIRLTDVIPVGGSQVTVDLAHALRISRDIAERVKVRYGGVLSNSVKSDDTIEIPGVSEHLSRQIQLKMLIGVIEARMEELLNMVYQKLQTHDLLDKISAGIVLTGGGAKVKGMTRLAEDIFKTPVRIGAPSGVTGIQDVLHNPIHATGVGLLEHCRDRLEDEMTIAFKNGRKSQHGLLGKMKSWLGKHF